MRSRERSDAIVLFGATGDLARKKLYPALYQMIVDEVCDGRGDAE